jgi:hypothetical protein
MAYNAILMAPCLRAGRVLEFFFFEETDLKASFTFGTFATVFQAELNAILACSDLCLRKCMTGKTISDQQNIKFAHTVIRAGASVPELSTGTFYS